MDDTKPVHADPKEGDEMKYRQIADIETAIRIYYQYPEINNKQICRLFGTNSSSTASRYKKAVKDEQIERNVKTMCIDAVNTKVAYDVWGIDVSDLEQRLKKLKSLGLVQAGKEC